MTRRRRASHRPESAFPRERSGRREALTGQVSTTLLAPRTVRRCWRDAGGLRVSTKTAQRLACDAGRVVMTHGASGQVLNVGRKTRTIPPALRRALAARDRRCHFPGCTARRCDAHHVRHWAHGGATRLDNLMQLCWRHHRAAHEGGLRVTLDDAGAVRFTRADGQPLPEVPEPPRWTGAALAPVDARLAAAGIAIGPDTAMPKWTGERLDLGWAMSVLWRPRASRNPRALEARQ